MALWPPSRGVVLLYLVAAEYDLSCVSSTRRILIHNAATVREDIAELYAGAEFTLAPTFELYCDIMDFIKHAGVVDRDEEDESPRRPLTAVRCL